MRRPPHLAFRAAAVAGLALLAGACRPGSVRVDFQPRAGAEYRYSVDVRASTTTAIEGRPATHNESDEHLRAHHRVQSLDSEGATVEVVVSAPSSPARTFDVRLDRAGSLVEVTRVEDIPASALGELGLAEVFPAAAGAPPNRALRPGTTWRINDPISLQGGEPVRLTGEGRLTELGRVHGRQVATIRSHYRLPVHESDDTPDGLVRLDGVQDTVTVARHALADGAIERAEATTKGRFSVTLAPPGGNGPELHGTLELDIRSVTTRR